MSIEVKEVSKVYGTQRALDNISFKIDQGEVVGFLGPNGAGKSTMMKILTGYIPPTSGEALVGGFNIIDQKRDIKKIIGYLPEHNPLYLDMYVKEYLSFIGGLHKISNKTARIKEVISQVGLQPEQHKKIGALSKGYRQRVGLAQALIHDPQVLILDEPTSGLDPNQIVGIRSLIKGLGTNKTIMLSTHIMQEVEAICDRVIIIKKGSIVADDVSQNLKSKSSATYSLIVEFDKMVEENKFLELKSVENLVKVSESKWILQVSTKDDIRKEVFNLAISLDASVLTMQREEEKLEDVFKRLTE